MNLNYTIVVNKKINNNSIEEKVCKINVMNLVNGKVYVNGKFKLSNFVSIFSKIEKI